MPLSVTLGRLAERKLPCGVMCIGIPLAAIALSNIYFLISYSLPPCPISYSSLTHQVVKVSATDEDSGVNSAITYAIDAGNEDERFGIDATSGQITLVRPLDRETIDSYTLVVTASDGTGNGAIDDARMAPVVKNGNGDGSQWSLTATALVKITVMDNNDNPPAFLQSADGVRRSVPEDSPPGTFVLPVTATDADRGNNAQIQYAIASGNVGRAFSIDGTTGSIYVAEQLDYETRSR